MKLSPHRRVVNAVAEWMTLHPEAAIFGLTLAVMFMLAVLLGIGGC